MNKNKGMRATSQFVGLLLCIILIQTACATENQNQFIVNFPNNSTLENATIDNSTMENVTIENPIIDDLGNVTIVDYSDNDTIIDPSYYYTYIAEGSSKEFTVNFTNNGDETLVLNPKFIATSNTNNINESWITISPANATVAPGSVQYFTIEVNVPLDSLGGYYQGKIAFTDNIVAYTEDYIDPQYVNSMQFNIWVEAQEKIQLQSSYISDNVEAGIENEYKIKVKNIATRDITIDPTLSTNEYYTYYEQAFGNNAIEISAPSTIKAGEIANVTIRVHVPENATGYYNGYINMNVNGKANDGYGPGISLYLNVWQPLVPFVKTFYTTTDDPIIIEVSGDVYRSDNEFRVSQEKDKLPFELGMTYNSNPINMTFMNSSESGSADIQEDYNYYPTWANENRKIYQNVRDHYTATYIVPGAIGEWDLSILPKGANNFQYSIKIANDNLEKTWNVTSENLVPGNSSTVNETDENTSIPIDGQESEVLIADFSTNVSSGYAPLTVQFTDNSALNEIQSSVPPTLSGEEQNIADGPANNISDSQETSEDDYLYGIANVESIQVMIMESFPVQVHVIAEGYLPSGCTEINEITTEREGDIFNIKISTKSPKDALCTQAIVPFSKTIPLEVQGLKAGNYTVNVNGVTGSFELAVDNTLDESSSDIPPRQQVITEADNGTSISLKKGENFTLKLRENPTTGYSWELYLSEGLSIISDEYTQDPAPEGYTGVPGTHSWIIEAVGQGNQQVNGIYKRPWESTTGTEKTFILNVTSISSDTISRIWNFGDGSTSTEQNPVHTFTTAGTYNVSLVASNENETATKTAAITVLEQTLPPVANFNSNVTEGYAPLSVQFIDLSENATEWNWDFGDQTYSTEKDPVHRYCKSGKYTVKLTVKNENGMDTEKRPKYISVPRRK